MAKIEQSVEMPAEDTPKRKRRSNAEVAAEKAAKAEALAAKTVTLAASETKEAEVWVEPKPKRKSRKASSTSTWVDSSPPRLPEVTGDFMPHSIIDAMSFLAKSEVDPCIYSDMFAIMRDVDHLINTYGLSEEGFLEVYRAFKPTLSGDKRR